MKNFSAHFRAMILVSGMLISHALPVSEPARMFFLGLGLIGIAGVGKRLNRSVTHMHGCTDF